MTQAAEIARTGHVPKVYSRNRLSDFDAIVEAVLRRAEDGGDPAPFVEEAAQLAKDLTELECVSGCIAAITGRPEIRREIPATVRHQLERAAQLAGAGEDLRAKLIAYAAKKLVQKWSCPCAKQVVSSSGRPIW